MTALPPVVGVLTDHQIFAWWGTTLRENYCAK